MFARLRELLLKGRRTFSTNAAHVQGPSLPLAPPFIISRSKFMIFWVWNWRATILERQGEFP